MGTPKICRICGQPVRPSEPQAFVAVGTSGGEYEHLHCYQGIQRTPPPDSRKPRYSRSNKEIIAEIDEMLLGGQSPEPDAPQQPGTAWQLWCASHEVYQGSWNAFEAGYLAALGEMASYVRQLDEAETRAEKAEAERDELDSKLLEAWKTINAAGGVREAIERERDEARAGWKEAGEIAARIEAKLSALLRERDEARAEATKWMAVYDAECEAKATWIENLEADVARLTAAPAEMREACASLIDRAASATAHHASLFHALRNLATACRAVPLPAAAAFSSGARPDE